MIVVDEYLAIRSLTGLLPAGLPDEPIAVTTSAHWRLPLMRQIVVANQREAARLDSEIARVQSSLSNARNAPRDSHSAAPVPAPRPLRH